MSFKTSRVEVRAGPGTPNPNRVHAGALTGLMDTEIDNLTAEIIKIIKIKTVTLGVVIMEGAPAGGVVIPKVVGVAHSNRIIKAIRIRIAASLKVKFRSIKFNPKIIKPPQAQPRPTLLGVRKRAKIRVQLIKLTSQKSRCGCLKL